LAVTKRSKDVVKKSFLTIIFLFISIVFVSARGDCIATDVCDGAAGFVFGGGMTVAGVVGFLLTVKFCSDEGMYSIFPLLGYGASSVMTSGGLYLMYQSFKKMIGIKPKKKKKIDLDDFELVPLSLS